MGFAANASRAPDRRTSDRHRPQSPPPVPSRSLVPARSGQEGVAKALGKMAREDTAATVDLLRSLLRRLPASTSARDSRIRGRVLVLTWIRAILEPAEIPSFVPGSSQTLRQSVARRSLPQGAR